MYSRIYGGIATMVIVSKYRLERNEEKDIFSNWSICKKADKVADDVDEDAAKSSEVLLEGYIPSDAINLR